MRNIVLWSVGAIQRDIEEALGTRNILFYIDDELDTKLDRIGELSYKVHKSEILKSIKKEDVFIILCAQISWPYIQILEQSGYHEGENYITYQRFWFDYDCNKTIEAIKKRRIAVYGTGNTYHDYKKYIQDNFGEISYLIDGTLKDSSLIIDGISVKNPLEVIKEDPDCYIIVTSSFYPKISKQLVEYGLSQEKDFVFVDTLYHWNENDRMLHEESFFENRSINSDKLLIVLAGYKEKLWEPVFDRIKSYLPEGYDVCVLTSGYKNEQLDHLCEINHWSYLWTKQNKISLIMNIAISLHKSAQFIYKMDEDIFVTKGVFEQLLATYESVKASSLYQIGFVSPLINVNSYGYARIIKKLGIGEIWEKNFGELKHTDGEHHHRKIWEDSSAAKFMWGENSKELINIDKLSERFSKEDLSYSICPIRYSIGMILLERETWIQMGLFPVTGGNNLGQDEMHLCKFCMMSGRAMVISENTVVGHLGYYKQTKDMMRYFHDHRDRFNLR